MLFTLIEFIQFETETEQIIFCTKIGNSGHSVKYCPHSSQKAGKIYFIMETPVLYTVAL